MPDLFSAHNATREDALGQSPGSAVTYFVREAVLAPSNRIAWHAETSMTMVFASRNVRPCKGK